MLLWLPSSPSVVCWAFFNRIVIRRVGGQLIHLQSLGMLRHKRLDRSGGMVACPILDQNQRLFGALEKEQQKGTVALGRKSLGLPLIEQAATKILDQAQHFVAFALASRFHQRLLATFGPSLAQRAPLSKAGFIAKQQQRLRTSRLLHDARPGLTQPVLAARLVQMIGDKARLLIGIAQVS
jgi:hypothetical protein